MARPKIVTDPTTGASRVVVDADTAARRKNATVNMLRRAAELRCKHNRYDKKGLEEYLRKLDRI